MGTQAVTDKLNPLCGGRAGGLPGGGGREAAGGGDLGSELACGGQREPPRGLRTGFKALPEAQERALGPSPGPSRARPGGRPRVMVDARVEGPRARETVPGAGPARPSAPTPRAGAGQGRGGGAGAPPGSPPRGRGRSVGLGARRGQHGARGQGPEGQGRPGAHAVRADPVLRPAGPRLRGLQALPDAGAQTG